MVKVCDVLEGTCKEFEGIEDACAWLVGTFGECMRDVIECMAEAYKAGQPVYEYEQYLGIEIA